MPLEKRCITCFERANRRLFTTYTLSLSEYADYLIYFSKVIRENDHLSSPEVQQLLNRKVKEITGKPDLYAVEKQKSNEQAKTHYPACKENISKSENPFKYAVRLAIAGNIMDYGAHDSFNIDETISRVMDARFGTDHTDCLKKQLEQAQHVLFIGDNAGEIVFDKLLIEVIDHPGLVYVVRGAPVLNDATMDDAIDVGLDKLCPVISTGADIPSVVLDKTSGEFQKYFREADLIISKGQGNLEGLLPLNDPRIFFLLMAKCDVIAELLSVKKGDFVVFNQNCR